MSIDFDGEQKYKYRGIPLSPNVIAELAPQLMVTEVFRRMELVEAVSTHHQANGGATSEANLVSATKKALSTLCAAGSIEKTGAYGNWRWTGWVAGSTPQAPNEADLADEVEAAIWDDAMIEGEGAGALYAYYFESYRRLAEVEGRSTWPHKVGMSSFGFHGRIYEQQGTAMPESPIIAYVYRSSIPGKIERLVHSVLFLRGRWIEDAPGAEWFDTNAETIQGIIDWAVTEPTAPDKDHSPSE